MMSPPASTTIFHAPDVSDADLALLRAALAATDRPWTIVSEPMAADVERPLFSRADVARLRRSCDRFTAAVLILAAVVVLIQLGRHFGIMS